MEHDFELVFDALRRVFGLVSFSPVVQTELDMDAIQQAALTELLADGQPETFKVEARRSLKSFPLNSMEINREVGGYLLEYLFFSPGVVKGQTAFGFKRPDFQREFRARVEFFDQLIVDNIDFSAQLLYLAHRVLAHIIPPKFNLTN
jgi:hypothetical protein